MQSNAQPLIVFLHFILFKKIADNILFRYKNQNVKAELNHHIKALLVLIGEWEIIYMKNYQDNKVFP